MRTFLLCLDTATVSQVDVTEHLDTVPSVKNWLSPMLGTILVVSDAFDPVAFLIGSLKAKFPGARFLVAPIVSTDANGWMPKPFWDLLSSPTASGRQPGKSLLELLALPPQKGQQPTMGDLTEEQKKP